QSNDGDLAGTCPGGATCPSWSNSGKFGKALDFDGTDDYVNADTASDDINTATGSVSAWIRREFEDTVAVNPAVFDIRTDGNNNIQIYYNAGDDIWRFKYKAGGTSATVSQAPGVIPKDTWTHVVLTWDTGEDEVRGYVNGVEVGVKQTGLGTWSGAVVYTYIGRFQSNAADIYDGLIDEVKIYPFALTEDEVKVEYNRGSAQVLGAAGTDASGNPVWSSERAYCPPGDTTANCGPIAEWK
ncbi:unnamed protein product, partial [marine sediment metagenome]